MVTRATIERPEEHASIFFSYEVLAGPYAGWSGRLLHWSDDGTVGYFEVRKGKEILGPVPIIRTEVRCRGARGK